ncbi:MAG: hypothetical protein ACR2IE_14795 [Candidatus Sumerlaeaceae bacterium]
MKRQRHQRGAALIWVLMLSALMLLGVASMLAMVRHLARSTNDKVAFEECFHVATGGIQMTNAWLLRADMAKSHLGDSVGGALEAITSGAVNLSTDVIIIPGYTLAAMSPQQQVADYYQNKYNSFSAAGTTLSDGRRVLYSFPAVNGKIIVLQNDALQLQTSSLFDPAAPRARSYISQLRITTPYPAGASGSNAAGPYTGETLGLRRTSLIIEAEAITLTAGIRKRRFIQQKVLVSPPVEGAPPLSTGEAIVSGAAMAVQGSSSLNVHWGPVKAKGNIALLDIAPLDVANKRLTSANKFFGAGIGNEYWLKWTCTGTLFQQNGSNQVPLFPTSINGQPVVDFFVQLLNGDFGSAWTNGTLRLDGTYNEAHVKSITNPNNPYASILTGNPTTSGHYALGTGALLQNFAPVGVDVDYLINHTLAYNAWKQFAIKRNGYARPQLASGNITGYTNSTGQKLYVTPSRTLTTNSEGNIAFTNLAQISMKSLVPSGGSTINLADRILFIDTPEGVEGGTKLTVSLSSNDAFFWKGLIYLNTNLQTAGGGAFPTILCKNPDQYRADPSGATGTPIQSCYLDGIGMVTGALARTGNAAIYGTLVAKGGYGGSGGPDIYYNSRNAHGLFKGLVSHAATFQIVEGPLQEMNQWPV